MNEFSQTRKNHVEDGTLYKPPKYKLKVFGLNKLCFKCANDWVLIFKINLFEKLNLMVTKNEHIKVSKFTKM